MIARLTLSVLMAALLLGLGCSSEGGEEAAPATDTGAVLDSSLAMLDRMGLNETEHELLDTLLYLWSERNIVASVQQAADMKGIEVSDSIRVDLLNKLREHLDLHPQLQLYRPWTFILTEKEKLIGQFIVSFQKDRAEFPTLEMIVEKVHLDPEQVKQRLAFLAQTDFLYDLGGPTEYNALGYSFGTRIGEVLFDMGLHFHTLYVDDKLPVNVGCANEAFYKILRDYAFDNVRYETVDPLTLEPVTVLFDSSQVVSIEPAQVIFLNGWYRGANNLFASQENGEIWTAKTPNVTEPPYLDIRAYIAQLRAEREKSGWNQGASN
ncbi:MAG: hypothetical protein ABIJ61_04635 [bacterium]